MQSVEHDIDELVSEIVVEQLGVKTASHADVRDYRLIQRVDCCEVRQPGMNEPERRWALLSGARTRLDAEILIDAPLHEVAPNGADLACGLGPRTCGARSDWRYFEETVARLRVRSADLWVGLRSRSVLAIRFERSRGGFLCPLIVVTSAVLLICLARLRWLVASSGALSLSYVLWKKTGAQARDVLELGAALASDPKSTSSSGELLGES